MPKPGDRIGAIFGSDQDKVQFLGYGVYEGDAIPVEAVGWMAEALVEANQSNPKLVLDSGEIVYGCECWWGSEEKIRKQLEGQSIENVSIASIRAGYKPA